MTVLYLTINPNRESTTVPTEGWFRALRPRGLSPVLASHRAGAFHAWATGEGIPSYEVPLPFPDTRRPAGFLRSLARLVWIGRRHGVALVHCNEHDVYPIGQYAARLLGVPAVVGAQFTISREFGRWAFRGRRAPARVFFTSRGNMEASRPACESTVPEHAWRVLYNGIDTERVAPDGGQRTTFRLTHGIGDDIAIGVACALRPRKQVDHLFKAAAVVPAVSRVVVAGRIMPGDEAYASGLLEEGRRLLGERFLYVGHLDDTRPFFNAMDLVVNTSQEEGCSLSIAEAMACGAPVVGYPSTSVVEQVLPGGGEIVPQDDVEALQAVLHDWTSDRRRLERARIDARARSECFDVRQLSEQLWGEYQQMARRQSARRAECPES